jgi:hypothetical protein
MLVHSLPCRLLYESYTLHLNIKPSGRLFSGIAYPGNWEEKRQAYSYEREADSMCEIIRRGHMLLYSTAN